jgi:hypothetical protein
MGEIGKYGHNKIILIWKGISVFNGRICAIIDFNAIDNSLEIDIEQLNAKGTEQYWGTCWVGLKTGSIEKGCMYSGTMLENKVKGFNSTFLFKTIRELWIEPVD